ncbi:uncharacterized protein LOC110392708 [Numida meleagris]|uniref:uncharacterized protein LOC110392708 n=1 Tax=Numida meleagris TaxID=8996 RepID=UPI000B3DC795|nr:uncharacterized protein LOC110392708 [Numida meleagris]
MKFSQALLVFLLLSMSPFTGRRPGRSSNGDWDEDREEELVPPEEPLLADTERQTSNWPSWLGLPSCPSWIWQRVSRAAATEGLKQQPQDAEQKAPESPFWLGLSALPIRIRERDSKTVLPEEKQPADTERQTSNWPSCLSLPSCPRCIWHRLSRADGPEGPKRQPLRTEQAAFSLPYLLGLLCDYMEQGGYTGLLMGALIDVCALCLLRVAHSLWGKVQRPREQGTRQMASGPPGTDEQLDRLQAQLDLLQRCLTTLESHAELNRQQSGKKAQGARKRSCSPPRSSSSSAVDSVGGQQESRAR